MKMTSTRIAPRPIFAPEMCSRTPLADEAPCAVSKVYLSPHAAGQTVTHTCARTAMVRRLSGSDGRATPIRNRSCRPVRWPDLAWCVLCAIPWDSGCVRVVTGLRNEHGWIVTEPAVVIVRLGWHRAARRRCFVRCGSARKRIRPTLASVPAAGGWSVPTGRDRLAPSGMACLGFEPRCAGEPSRSARRKARLVDREVEVELPAWGAASAGRRSARRAGRASSRRHRLGAGQVVDEHQADVAA